MLGHQTLDPDLGSGSRIRIRDPDPESGSAIRKNAGSGSVSGSALNQCGSETLILGNTSTFLSLFSFCLSFLSHFLDSIFGFSLIWNFLARLEMDLKKIVPLQIPDRIQTFLL